MKAKHNKRSKQSVVGQFPIVGIGASAGGLEAFTELLKHLPTDTGLGFVLVQHLDPQHASSLSEILTRATSMPVREVANNLRVEPNHIYVIPPNTRLAIAQGVLKLRPRQPGHAPTHSIDAFLESLAQDQHERAIGVILSGTATDGTVGLEAIKAEGGITFAQDDSAKYNSMPRSAVAAGCVDFVLSPADIAGELARIAKHPYIAGETPLPAREEKTERAMAGEDGHKKILLLLRNHVGVDFSLYKSTTIRRRIHRRMVLGKKDTLDQYANFLRRNAKELQTLYSDCLINVTSFFRNPDSFELLQRKIFPELLKQRNDDPVRVWVLGCSTGQEAYSLAMAFQEIAEKSPRLRKLQVFATDLNDALLEKARQGLYAKNLVEDVSPERLRQFFIEEDNGYRVIKSLREQVVFARQNLINDPPFSRMDLISCRNLLIYLEPSLQKKVMPMFHYALKPDGFLLLGASESVGGFNHLFEPIDRKHKVYSKKGVLTPAVALPLKQGRREKAPAKPPVKAGKPELPEGLRGELNAQREADRVMVNQFAPPGVLINAELQILQFRGPTSAYLEPPTGKASFDVLKMAREGLMLPLRTAINQAKKQNKTVRRDNVPVRQNGKTRPVNIEVIPLKNLRERCFLVLFHDAAKVTVAPPVVSVAGRKESPSRIKHLETELTETRDYMQSIQEQHEAAHEELQASNEEVQSANEELQSLNEELETSKEELESANEELTTLNEEMANRNVELQHSQHVIAAARDYAEAIVRTVASPLVILDDKLRVHKANEAFYKTFHVTQSESEGQLIYELGNRQWDIATLRELLEHILPDRGVFNDFEVTHAFEKIGQRTMVLNARRLDALEGQPARILLGIQDITERKQADSARSRLAAIVESSDDAIISKDLNGVITTWNAGAERMFGYTAKEAIGQPVIMLIPQDHAKEEPLILERIRRGESIEHYETVRRRKDGSLLDVSLTVSPIVDSRGQIIGASKIARDITEHKRLEAELAAWRGQLEARVATQKEQLVAEGEKRERLEAEIAGAVEGEQQRIGQELHDGLAQELTGLGYLMDALETKLRKASPAGAKEAHRLREMLDKARDSARDLAKGFYPVALEKHGLIAALHELAMYNKERFSVPIAVEADNKTAFRLNDARAIQFFRIAQEAVHNAVKHAHAKRIVIRLTTKGDDWQLAVKDDGTGLKADPQAATGMGLRIMQHRARMIGGKLEVHNDGAGGVIVSCSAPAPSK